MKENMNKIRGTQRENRQKKQEEECKDFDEPFKMKRFQNVPSRLSESKQDQEHAHREFLKRGSGKNLAQTPNSSSPPSSRGSRRQLLKPPVPHVDDAPALLPRKHIDFLRKNAEDSSVSHPKETKEKSISRNIEEKDRKARKHENFGSVPEYLLKRKEEWVIEAEDRLKRESEADCPLGMRIVSEEERLETLKMLQDNILIFH